MARLSRRAVAKGKKAKSKALKGGRRGGLFEQGKSTVDDAMLALAGAADDDAKKVILQDLSAEDKALIKGMDLPVEDAHKVHLDKAKELLASMSGGRRKPKSLKKSLKSRR
jgi:hypothetical protein